MRAREQTGKLPNKLTSGRTGSGVFGWRVGRRTGRRSVRWVRARAGGHAGVRESDRTRVRASRWAAEQVDRQVGSDRAGELASEPAGGKGLRSEQQLNGWAGKRAGGRAGGQARVRAGRWAGEQLSFYV